MGWNRKIAKKIYTKLLKEEVSEYCKPDRDFYWDKPSDRKYDIEWSVVNAFLDYSDYPFDTIEDLLFAVCFKLGFLEQDEIHKIACKLFPSKMRFFSRSKSC